MHMQNNSGKLLGKGSAEKGSDSRSQARKIRVDYELDYMYA